MLFVAAVLTGALGIAHSILGERYLISWLLRHDLPKLLGDTGFAAGTIRFAWHGLLPIYFTRGRHLSWVVLFVAGGLCLASALLTQA